MYWELVAILKNIDFKEMNPSLVSEVLISRSELKEYFTSQEIQVFSDYLSCQKVETGSLVMAEGEPADCLMYMLSGKARVLAEGIQIGDIEVGDFRFVCHGHACPVRNRRPHRTTRRKFVAHMMFDSVCSVFSTRNSS